MCLHMCIICVLFDTILFLLPDFSVLHLVTLSHGAIIIGRVCPFMIDEHFCCRYMYMYMYNVYASLCVMYVINKDIETTYAVYTCTCSK